MGLVFQVCTINKNWPSEKKSGNLFKDPRMCIYIYIYIIYMQMAENKKIEL